MEKTKKENSYEGMSSQSLVEIIQSHIKIFARLEQHPVDVEKKFSNENLVFLAQEFSDLSHKVLSREFHTTRNG